MNLALFFDSLPDALLAPTAVPTALAAYITAFGETFPDWRSADLALIGLDEWRGTAAGAPPPGQHGANCVRKRFYQLQKGTKPLRLVDLGNLRPGPTLEDTYQRLREVVAALLEAGTVPLLLGGGHDLDIGQFTAYEAISQAVTFAVVDARPDMGLPLPSTPADETHLRRLLTHEPNILFSCAHLAHQQYLVPADVLAAFEKLHFEMLSVGKIRADHHQAEPLLRQADFLSFDIAAIRWQDAPGYQPASPYGLSNEDAAQLCWYAGHNAQLTSLGLYGYRPEHDPHGLAAATLATMLWYFVEGYYHRKPETGFGTYRFLTYTLVLPNKRQPDAPTEIVFYKSRRQDDVPKWWMQVEGLTDRSLRRIVPCTHQDYLSAAQGDLPRRWLWTQALLG